MWGLRQEDQVGDQLELCGETLSQKTRLYPNRLFYGFLKIRKLQNENERLLSKLKEVSETQKELKDQSVMVSKMEMENLNLSQKVHKWLKEIKSMAKKRDFLKSRRRPHCCQRPLREPQPE